MKRYRIWSHEHTAWWAPNHSGYTTDVAAAGLYTRDEAADITLDVVPSGVEVAVPEGSELHAIYGCITGREELR